jgi:phage-related protein
MGQDRGVVLSYGKNIINIQADENWSEVVTKLLPVGKDGLLLPETYHQVIR